MSVGPTRHAPPSTGRYVLLAVVMLLFPLAALPRGGTAAHKKHLEKSLAANGRPVHIAARISDVTITAGTASEVRLTADLEIRGRKSWMEEIEKSFDVELVERAGAIEIRPSRLESENDFHLFDLLSGVTSTSVDLRLAIEVPPGTALEIENRYGDVVVRGVGGTAKIDNHSGDVTVEDGGPVEVENEYGDLDLARIAGGIEAKNGSGKITIADVRDGGRVESSYGNVSLARVGGPLTITVKSGDLSGEGLRGTVGARASYGDADLRDLGSSLDLQLVSGHAVVSGLAGAATIDNSYGSVRLERAGGDVAITGKSTDVKLTDVRGNVKIDTSYGSIDLHAITGRIEAASASGSLGIQGAGGDTTVRVSYGPVVIRGASGALDIVSQSGDVEVENLAGAALAAHHRIEARYGDVTFGWPAAATPPSFVLAANSGELESAFPGTRSEEKSWHFLRSENVPAAPALDLRSQSGTVTLRRD